MTLKLTAQGGLIYLTGLFFVATLVLLMRSRKERGSDGFAARMAGGCWCAAFLAALASVIWRGIHTGHPPMQNLFEFFLCMIAALVPLSYWNRWRHGLDTRLQDAILGCIILFPAGFVFSDADLLGIPLRLVISAKTVADGEVEFRTRACRDSRRVKLAEIPAFVAAAIREDMARFA